MKTLRQMKTFWIVSIIAVLLAGVAVGVAKCPKWDAQKKQRTIESVERQLKAGGRIYYEDLARQAYEDSGWSNERVLQDWLAVKEHDPTRIQKLLKIHSNTTVWLVDTQDPERDIVATHEISVHAPTGPIRGWDFYVDKDGVIRAYSGGDLYVDEEGVVRTNAP